MAYRIGIVGNPNTGKSYSRTTLKEPEKTFVISPSQKMTYLKDTEGKSLKRANVSFEDPNGQPVSYQEMVLEQGVDPKAFLKELLRDLKNLKNVTLTGNWIVVRTLEELSYWTHLVNKLRPDVHTLILPDFTHYVSTIISSHDFIKRKNGGEAFQRLV